MKQPNGSQEETPLDWDATLHTLAAPRRRSLLAALAEIGGEATISDLSHHMYAAEQNIRSEDVTEEDANELLVPLHHVHVPKLIDTGVLEWTDDSQRIRLTQQVHAHPLLLPLAQRSQHPPSIPAPPSETTVGSD
jgi:DNA-binding transcriptional ArsR family regulator